MVPIARDLPVATPDHDSDLLSEILAAEADFERGDYIDLTPEQLARATETGELGERMCDACPGITSGFYTASMQIISS